MPTISNDNASAASASGSASLPNVSDHKLRPLVTILKSVMDKTVKILAGGEEEIQIIQEHIQQSFSMLLFLMWLEHMASMLEVFCIMNRKTERRS